jgi:hypothetical protein
VCVCCAPSRRARIRIYFITPAPQAHLKYKIENLSSATQSVRVVVVGPTRLIKSERPAPTKKHANQSSPASQPSGHQSDKAAASKQDSSPANRKLRQDAIQTKTKRPKKMGPRRPRRGAVLFACIAVG